MHSRRRGKGRGWGLAPGASISTPSGQCIEVGVPISTPSGQCIGDRASISARIGQCIGDRASNSTAKGQCIEDPVSISTPKGRCIEDRVSISTQATKRKGDPVHGVALLVLRKNLCAFALQKLSVPVGLPWLVALLAVRTNRPSRVVELVVSAARRATRLRRSGRCRARRRCEGAGCTSRCDPSATGYPS